MASKLRSFGATRRTSVGPVCLSTEGLASQAQLRPAKCRLPSSVLSPPLKPRARACDGDRLVHDPLPDTEVFLDVGRDGLGVTGLDLVVPEAVGRMTVEY